MLMDDDIVKQPSRSFLSVVGYESKFFFSKTSYSSGNPQNHCILFSICTTAQEDVNPLKGKSWPLPVQHTLLQYSSSYSSGSYFHDTVVSPAATGSGNSSR